jgi:hypothetical protein
MTATVMDLPVPRVSPGTRAIVESQAALVVAYGGADERLMDVATREVCTALVSDAGHVLDGTEIHDHFSAVVDFGRELDLLLADPDGYLASIPCPQTTEQRLRVEADLRSDRAGALERLYALVTR